MRRRSGQHRVVLSRGVEPPKNQVRYSSVRRWRSHSEVVSIWKPKRAKAMKFDLTGKAGFPAAVAVDSLNLYSKLKSKE